MGTLFIVATPIGNLDDISIRAIKTIFSVEYIACEDTRRSGQLLGLIKQKFETGEISVKSVDFLHTPKLISYYDEVETYKSLEIVALLKDDHSVALLSDAGTPLISDPGFKLVRECIKEGISVSSIPGPSSVVEALITSGLPINQFLFLGYLPPKQTKRVMLLTEIKSLSKQSKDIHPTYIFFETANRLSESLLDISSVLGDIEVVISRELTKMHEEIWRGPISACKEKEFKGELVLLFSTI